MEGGEETVDERWRNNQAFIYAGKCPKCEGPLQLLSCAHASTRVYTKSGPCKLQEPHYHRMCSYAPCGHDEVL